MRIRRRGEIKKCISSIEFEDFVSMWIWNGWFLSLDNQMNSNTVLFRFVFFPICYHITMEPLGTGYGAHILVFPSLLMGRSWYLCSALYNRRVSEYHIYTKSVIIFSQVLWIKGLKKKAKKFHNKIFAFKALGFIWTYCCHGFENLKSTFQSNPQI